MQKTDGALGMANYGFDLDTGKYLTAMSILTTDAAKRSDTRKYFRHELLHGIGLDHIKPSGRVSLMNPIITIKRPTAADWRAVRQLDDRC